MVEKLIYQTSPAVTLCTNTFINVPIVLQFDDTPLISIVREQSLKYTTEIPIEADEAGETTMETEIVRIVCSEGFL